MKGVWWLPILVCVSLLTQAQLPSNKRTKQFISITGNDTLQLDSAPVFKGTLKLYREDELLNEGVAYTIDYLSRSIILKNQLPKSTITATYQVILLDLAKPFQHKNSAIVQREFQEIRNPFVYRPDDLNKQIIRNDGLRMNGSLSRGLAFGNNQDVVVNSNLNLQLAGKLANDIDVLAAISDDNNPIQPEGNTQQLQDFDRVYIQLSKNQTRLTVGDFEMTRPNRSYFMNYYKKSRGLQAYSGYTFKNQDVLRYGGEGALSRGRFARNIINGIEGNLGPYRLSGVNGELYIIIISGTEAVYLDGERMKRGEQNDYVIDYNTGEVTFMPKRMITQYSRIVVEFQYSDRNYARSVFHANSEYESSKYRIRANYFREQDSKNQPFLQDLTDSNKAILASVGDNINAALAPTATATREFSNRKILYRLIDTLGAQGVFVYTNQPIDTVYYEVSFSFVGQGNGDYVQALSSANGRVFNYVPPVGGIRQGSFAPVRLLISPKSLQMTTVGADLMLIKNTTISVELAQSDYDKNLFSDKDKSNDIGYGIQVSILNSQPLQAQTKDPFTLKSEIRYEHVDRNFRYVERYRNVEFDRTWNRQLSNTANADTGFDEHIVSAKTSLVKQSIGSAYYQLGYYDKEGLFNGLQHLAGAQLRYKKNAIATEAEWINTRNTQGIKPISNAVKRYRADVSRELFFLTSGVRAEYEESRFNSTIDSLLLGSFAYSQFTVYTRSTDTTRLRYQLDYTQREDYQPRNGTYQSSTLARSVNGSMEFVQRNYNRFSGSFSYRDFEVRDTAFSRLQPERTILSRIEYDYAFLKRVFTANSYFQLGSGQELRRDFQFIEVPVGQGVYVWKDFNNDGIQGLNEFVIASLSDRLQANYVKVFLPTNTIIRTNTNQFNQTLNIQPGVVWSNKTGMRKFISRWSNQTALRLDRKTTVLDALDFLNPFSSAIADSNVIAVSSLGRNTLFFNRADPTFGFDLNYQQSRNKSFLTNGFETRQRTEQGINARWNITPALGLNMGYVIGDRNYASDFFALNNFDYQFFELKPKVIYQLSQQFRITLLYNYFEGNNRADLGKQNGNNQEFGTELRYNVAKQGAINGKFSLYKVAFSGDISSPLGYDMLQGLAQGDNSVWNINYQQRLSNNLQLNISYDGRKSEGQPIIHIGRMEARYLF